MQGKQSKLRPEIGAAKTTLVNYMYTSAEGSDNSLYWKAPEYAWLYLFVPNCEHKN